MKQILDQIRALHTDSTSTTSPQPPSEPIRQLSPLKALTEQLKRGSTGRRTRTSAIGLSCLPAAAPSGSLSPELAGRVGLVLKELQSLNRKIDSNLQLLQPYVTFLRTAQQVWVSSGVPLERKMENVVAKVHWIRFHHNCWGRPAAALVFVWRCITAALFSASLHTKNHWALYPVPIDISVIFTWLLGY